jgi:hypothetical protein
VENKVSLWHFVKIQCHKNYGISNFIQMTLRPYHLYALHRKYGQADQTAQFAKHDGRVEPTHCTHLKHHFL